MGKKSLTKLKKKMEKRNDNPEKESWMEKIRTFEQKKDELWDEIDKWLGQTEGKNTKKLCVLFDYLDSKKWKPEGKDKKKNELQTKTGELQIEVEHLKELKSEKENEDERQIEVERLQKENNELKVELNWRRTHQYADDITLNPDTAHPNLSMSDDKKKCIHEAQPQKVPPTPERFDSTVCVLGSEGFYDVKHYWEVDVRSSTDWDLGLASKAIKRKGKLPLSPKEGFWALGLNGRDYWAKTDPWTRVTVQKKPKKIGVYLNYQDKQVTFFNVTDMSVLFTFNDCSFSGEVYPFFKNSHKETSMRICSLREDE